MSNSAMREALEAVSKAFDDALICTDYQMSYEEHERLDDIYHKVKDALAKPPKPMRNCDVGTAEEQIKRHKKHCGNLSLGHCGRRTCRECFAEWAQMPYETRRRRESSNEKRKEQ